MRRGLLVLNNPTDTGAWVDRLRVVDVVVALANAFDAQDWDRVRLLLADALDVDYSEFRGEPPGRVSADEYVEARRSALQGLRTLHVSTNHEVNIVGDQATCHSAYHIQRVDPVSGGRLESWGTYRHQLVLDGDRWRVTGIVQRVVRVEGERTVHGAFRGR